MAVTHDDVRAVAALARLGVAPERLDKLVVELNAILSHMDVLARVDTAGTPDASDLAPAMRTAEDSGPSVPLVRPMSELAPDWRDGFFIVPRLASHGDVGNADDESA